MTNHEIAMLLVQWLTHNRDLPPSLRSIVTRDVFDLAVYLAWERANNRTDDAV